MREVDLIIDEFEDRWNEAKASGCTAVLFNQDKWSMIDIVLEEAKRSTQMRRELIASRMGYKKAQQRDADEGVSVGQDDSRGNIITFPAAS